MFLKKKTSLSLALVFLLSLLLTACGREDAAPTAASSATSAAASATTAAAGSATTAAGTATTAAAATTASAASLKPGATVVRFVSGRDDTGNERKLIEQFNQQNDKIQILYEDGSPNTTALRERFITALNAKDSSIDVLAVDGTFVAEFASAGWIAPLDDLVPAAEREKFFPGPMAGATYQGKAYAVPWYVSVAGLFYRKDLLDKAGLKPPTTYEELIAAAKKIKEDPANANLYGFDWQGAQYEGGSVNFLEFIWNSGGNAVDKDNKVVLNSPESLKGFQLMYDLIHTNKTSPIDVTTWQETESRTAFSEGRSIFHRNWLSDYKLLLDASKSKVADKFGVVPLPSATAGKSGSSALGGWTVALNTYSKNPKEAAEVIKFLTSDASVKFRYLNTGRLPTRSATFDDAEVQKAYPYVKDMKAAFDQARPRPVTAAYSDISTNVIQPIMAEVLQKKKSPEQGLKEMDEKIKSLIAKSGGK